MKNQTGKYLKYAIGEIILVVIGILIALQINNWNNKRLQRIEEKIILENLKDDFLSAIEEFEFLNSVRTEVISSAKALYEIDPDALEDYRTNYLDSLLMKTMNSPTFNNQSGSLSVLLSSGKINLISNQNLKEQLIEWPGDVEDMTEDEINHNKLYTGKYFDLLDKYISINKVIRQMSYSGVRFSTKNFTGFEENPNVVSNYKLLLKDKVYLNTLRRRAVFCQISKSETESLIQSAKKIISNISKELDNTKQ